MVFLVLEMVMEKEDRKEGLSEGLSVLFFFFFRIEMVFTSFVR